MGATTTEHHFIFEINIVLDGNYAVHSVVVALTCDCVLLVALSINCGFSVVHYLHLRVLSMHYLHLRIDDASSGARRRLLKRKS